MTKAQEIAKDASEWTKLHGESFIARLADCMLDFERRIEKLEREARRNLPCR